MTVAVLALAPGDVTGWALVGASGKVIACGATPAEDVADVIDHLVRLAHRNGASVESVVELGPSRDLGAAFARQSIADWLEIFDVPSVDVAPSSWARSAAARDFAYPEDWGGRPLDPRQRDALSLAAYYIKPGPQLRKLKAGAWTPWRGAA